MMVDVDHAAAHAATGGVAPNRADPAIVLIHGAGMNSTIWQLQTRYLAHRDYQAVAVDLPGHGRSVGQPLTDIAAYAEWLVRFLDAAQLHKVNLVGHSMGALIAIEAAARLGNRCSSLVLMGAATTMPVHPQLIADAESNLPAAAALMAAWGHAKPAHVGRHPTPGMWMTGGARALVERSNPGVLATDFKACAAYDNAAAAVASIVAPTSIIIGMGDKMTPPKSGRTLAGLFANPNVLELADTGHSMMTEHPTAVRNAILATAN